MYVFGHLTILRNYKAIPKKSIIFYAISVSCRSCPLITS
ncbi:hypothetical protein DSUL_100011 [Desulfovibrionales bacterium]